MLNPNIHIKNLELFLGSATLLKWRTHFRPHFGANQGFCRTYYVILYLQWPLSRVGVIGAGDFFHIDSSYKKIYTYSESPLCGLLPIRFWDRPGIFWTLAQNWSISPFCPYPMAQIIWKQKLLLMNIFCHPEHKNLIAAICKWDFWQIPYFGIWNITFVNNFFFYHLFCFNILFYDSPLPNSCFEVKIKI